MTHWIAPDNTLLLNVDLTNDFLPGGSVAVTDGEYIIPLANELRTHFIHVGWTREEHDKHHAFFASSHPGKKPLDVVITDFGPQYLWPDHCVTGSYGAAFHPDLVVEPDDLIVVKGTDPSLHAYSAVLMDDRQTLIHYPDDGKTLPQKLREQRIDRVVITGLAYDFCVGMTACDLAQEGFAVILVRDATRSIAKPLDEGLTTEDRMADMLRDAGVITLNSHHLPNYFRIPPSTPTP